MLLWGLHWVCPKAELLQMKHSGSGNASAELWSCHQQQSLTVTSSLFLSAAASLTSTTASTYGLCFYWSFPTWPLLDTLCFCFGYKIMRPGRVQNTYHLQNDNLYSISFERKLFAAFIFYRMKLVLFHWWSLYCWLPLRSIVMFLVNMVYIVVAFTPCLPKN